MGLLKRIANRSADLFFMGPWLEQDRLRYLKGRAVGICYHRVDDPKNHTFLTENGYPAIRPDELEADILFLKKRGFDFITFADWRAAGKLDPDRPHAILTFDDCFKADYANSLPVLKKMGAKAVFFQIASLVDSKEFWWEPAIFWHCHEPERAKRFAEMVRSVLPNYPEIAKKSGKELSSHLVECLPFEQTEKVIRAMRALRPSEEELRLVPLLNPEKNDLAAAYQAGHEIGSHGYLHYKRECVSSDVFERDLALSVEKLRSLTGITPLSYAYPHGNFVDGDKAICAKYFKHVATANNGSIGPETDPLEMPRYYWTGSFKHAIRRKRWLLTGTY